MYKKKTVARDNLINIFTLVDFVAFVVFLDFVAFQAYFDVFVAFCKDSKMLLVFDIVIYCIFKTRILVTL